MFHTSQRLPYTPSHKLEETSSNGESMSRLNRILIPLVEYSDSVLLCHFELMARAKPIICAT